MEVKIGITDSPRELVFTIAQTPAEVEELVEPGEIDPDHVVTPGIYVKHMLQGENYERRIERRTVRKN